jgi:hypothetical protein
MKHAHGAQFMSPTRDRGLWFSNRRYGYELAPRRNEDPRGHSGVDTKRAPRLGSWTSEPPVRCGEAAVLRAAPGRSLPSARSAHRAKVGTPRPSGHDGLRRPGRGNPPPDGGISTEEDQAWHATY